MKIAYFTATYYPTPDGVSYYLRDVKSELEQLGHEVHVFSLNGDKSEKNVHIPLTFPLPMYKQYSIPFNMIPARLYNYVLKSEFDIIHIHDPFFGTLGHIQNLHYSFILCQAANVKNIESISFSINFRNIFLIHKKGKFLHILESKTCEIFL